ncbi:hypothetical protein DQW50_00435 [Halorubrum sp. 48-1-W]|uniref:hypothetical protein n=1 Tax=Halorubrum sp. 48-1-W TaxID=2249761 RepID=UPI000DCCE0D1|nr:hypothetical protein [Halorubrum sp. 48-1-W]RAW46895.1 hypothetical protein DQW50_00435 [Halorubrum sp. 48-1-W]
MNRNTSKIGGILLAAFVLISGIGLGVGGVAAQEADDPMVFVDDSTTISNSTESVYVDVTGADDMSGNGPIDVDVTVEGLEEGQDAGNGTELDTATLSVAAGATESYSYDVTDTDVSDYDSVHVTAEVTTDGDEEHIASTDWGLLERTSGGGGGLLDDSSGNLPIVGVLVVAGAVLLLTRED